MLTNTPPISSPAWVQMSFRQCQGCSSKTGLWRVTLTAAHLLSLVFPISSPGRHQTNGTKCFPSLLFWLKKSCKYEGFKSVCIFGPKLASVPEGSDPIGWLLHSSYSSFNPSGSRFPYLERWGQEHSCWEKSQTDWQAVHHRKWPQGSQESTSAPGPNFIHAFQMLKDMSSQYNHYSP